MLDSPFPSPSGGLDEVKAAIRKAALERRRASPPGLRAEFALRLKTEGVALARRLESRTVSVFMPIRGEPDTLALLEGLGAAGFATALPVTIGDGAPLVFRAWTFGDPTRPGPMGIPEPLPEAPAVDPDLLFAPLSAFDRQGNRIGYGKGHYDRSLRALRAKGRAIAAGVAYACCEAPAIPVGPYDEPLDFVLTDRELIAAARA